MSDAGGGYTPQPSLPTAATIDYSRERKRRDKPQLSCNACRRRKVRCDRQRPCNNCSSRGLGSSCTYYTSNEPPSHHLTETTHVQDRINQLESLVLNLMQQTNASSPASFTDMPPATPETGASVQGLCLPGPNHERPMAIAAEIQRAIPPSPSDHGSIKILKTGISYVSSAHWAAVLDSIAELRDHVEQDEGHTGTNEYPIQMQAQVLRPQLLYGCSLQVTVASIIQSMPPRSVVDKLVSRYFNDLDMATGIVHRGKFLREYEHFWQDPENTPVMWVGLLLTMMCLSTQFKLSFLTPENNFFNDQYTVSSSVYHSQMTVDLFRERIVQCLHLGHYTKGGTHVVETLILYFMVEVFDLKEVEIGIWVLVGNIIQIATHMGYHRDAAHFPNLSPFTAEMRRRVWAMIMQLDFSISTQIGLPRMIKESQTDTAEPRNLADTDFDENSTDLPASRPEVEVTPTLYTLAKLRILAVGTKIADVTTEPRTYPYSTILDLDKQIQDAQMNLPPSMKWEGLAACLTIPPLEIMQRIWIKICVQRLKIVLHKRFLALSWPQQQYAYSKSACITAAMEILEFQHLVDDETQEDGRLYQIRWRVSTAFTHEFLLATSVLCFYLQVLDAVLEKEGEVAMGIGSQDILKIKQLLRTSQSIWLRLSDGSTEAKKAATALHYVLRDSSIVSFEPMDAMPDLLSSSTVPYFQGFLEDFTPNYTTSEGPSWSLLL
ncbi:fungal-specific transcription factor domain protein [Dendryphion nanum]|uniref:Fungal-specific transcription factor domain protein n=1 Tax=Dendryphion nanum TaxID=256645 RepID=A0A9P9IDF5_9PLEO|nr:fungal-specific transcription factor domain protein [Dendryphion nanum]